MSEGHSLYAWSVLGGVIGADAEIVGCGAEVTLDAAKGATEKALLLTSSGLGLVRGIPMNSWFHLADVTNEQLLGIATADASTGIVHWDMRSDPL